MQFLFLFLKINLKKKKKKLLIERNKYFLYLR